MPMTMRTTTSIEPAAATHGVALPPNIWMAVGFSRSTPCVDAAFPMNPADAATHGVALLR